MYILALALGIILAWLIVKRTSRYVPQILSRYSIADQDKAPVMVFPESKKGMQAPIKATKSLLSKTSVMMPFGPVPTNVVTPSLVDKPVYKFDDLAEAAFRQKIQSLGPSSATNPNTPIDVQTMFANAPPDF